MRLDRFTSKFQLAISDAQSLALGRDHQYIEPVHLMQALLNQEGSSIRPLMTLLNVDVIQLRANITEMLDRLPKVTGTGGDVQLSNGMGILLNMCDKLAQKRNDKYISSELFILAAVEEKGPLGESLRGLGLTLKKSNKPLMRSEAVRTLMIQMRKRQDKHWRNSLSISRLVPSKVNLIQS